MMRSFLTAMTVLLVLPAHMAAASDQYLDHFARDVGHLDGRAQRHYNLVLQPLDAGDYAAAQTAMEKLLENLDPERVSRLTHARLLQNAGILMAINGQRQREALDLLRQGAGLLEQDFGQYDLRLLDILLAQGMVLLEIEDLDGAEDALRRAQHIVHRNHGVYAWGQIPVINYLTEINLLRLKQAGLSERLLEDADRQQRFKLMIGEREFGPYSEELVPVLQQVGRYFADRGEEIPFIDPEVRSRSLCGGTDWCHTRHALFREAIASYERAIQIIKDTYGENDSRLVNPLRGLAWIRLMQQSARNEAERAMEEAVALIEADPATDLLDRARALRDLGDVYIMTSDPKASEVYLEAWSIMGSDPELIETRNQWFGVPTRIYPEPSPLFMSRKPLAAEEGEDLFADLSYTIETDGRVADIEIIDANVPNDQKVKVKAEMRVTRYRPRIVDGEVVNTPELFLHQTFEVLAPKEPVAKISINSGT